MNLELVSRENPEIQIARNYGQISFSYVSSSSPHGIRQFVKIQRDLTSDQFSVIVTVFSKIVGKVNVYVQVNNAAPTAPKLLELFPEKFNQAVFVFGGPNQIKDKTADFKFPKLDNILVYLTKENEQKILLDNVLKLRNFSDANKEYSIKNKGIGFKVLKSIKMANLGADASIEFSKTYEKIEENTIYFFPDKFSQKKHNQNVFKVGVDPEVFYAGNIDKNINITNLKLTNLPVKSTSGSKNYLDLSFQFRQDIYDKNKKPEVIAGKYIVGDIFIISNTYYDSTERTVFSGN
ncbi:hypothetical protein MFC_01120 [Mesomycoplasma flocculare ATCC 27716]|nr:hypothetical protein [Mesomycoplasma flocculare]ENX50831.1 hypothetical protein MFC_01120 [Mesomycoplasma flocculare ATCC 27716]